MRSKNKGIGTNKLILKKEARQWEAFRIKRGDLPASAAIKERGKKPFNLPILGIRFSILKTRIYICRAIN